MEKTCGVFLHDIGMKDVILEFKEPVIISK